MGKYWSPIFTFFALDRINDLNNEASGLRNRIQNVEENRANL